MEQVYFNVHHKVLTPQTIAWDWHRFSKHSLSMLSDILEPCLARFSV